MALPVELTSPASNRTRLSFPTFLGLAYQVRFNNDLGDATWLVLTNTIGDGTTKLVSDVVVAPRRFYQVACVCN